MGLLRKEIKKYIGGKRYEHTLSVENECLKLGEIYSLNKSDAEKLCCAALLHDITKEKTLDEQLELCHMYNIPYSEADVMSPKIFHALTAAELARRDFPEYTDDVVYYAVRSHTTGRENMTIIDKLLYLADYIEETRKFNDCVKLREYFYSKVAVNDVYELLHNTLILSFDMTIRVLLDEAAVVNEATIKSRNYLLMESNNE